MLPTDRSPTPATITAEASRANLLAQIEELDRDNAFLRERLRTYRDRLDTANARFQTMSRVARGWMLIRYTVRRPWTAPRFPGDLARIIRNTPAPGPRRTAEPPTPDEQAATRGAAARAVGAARSERRVPGPMAPRRLADLQVAVVADSWLLDALDPECRVTALRPETWRTALEADPPDLLLVHSAWLGRGGVWQYRLAASPFPEAIRLDAIREIAAWCAERDIPRVLWDTEPYQHWRRFRGLAALVDHVVAADRTSVEAYAGWPPRTAISVDHLPIGIQPRTHHPDASAASRSDQPAFVGHLAVDVALDRREAVERLLVAGANRGALIHDRAGRTDPQRFRVPDGLAPHIAPRAPGENLGDLYRRYRPVLLEGSGPRPDAAVPRSILEAMACGVPIVTTLSPAVERMVGTLAFEADAIGDIERAIDAASTVDARGRALGEGVARIMADHTIAARLRRMCAIAGLPVEPVAQRPSAAVLVDEWSDAAHLAATFERVAPLVGDLVLGAPSLETATRAAAVVAGVAPGQPIRSVVVEIALGRGERLRRLAAAADGSWVAILGPDIADDPELVRDWSARVWFSRADAIGRPLDDGSGDRAVDAIDPRSAVVRRTSLLANGWPDGTTGSDRFGPWLVNGRLLHAFARPAGPGNSARPAGGTLS